MKQFDEAFRLGITLGWEDQVLLMGSCFAENIGEHLISDHFKVVKNPFGITFHPSATARLLNRALNGEMYSSSDFFSFDGYYWSYEHHGLQAQTDLEEYINTSNAKMKMLQEAIQNSNTFICTFGTAWGYVKENQVVANCHKQPQGNFEKQLTSVEAIYDEWSALIAKIKSLNPKIRIVFTVSPVRHWKDGLVENAQSKSTLLLSIQKLLESDSNVLYYPVYEYVVDVLRDYSFFEKDKVHLRDEVIEGLYLRFIEHLLKPEDLEDWKQWKSVQRKLAHRLLHPKSDSAKKFVLGLKDEFFQLKEKSVEIDFSAQEHQLKKMIEQIEE